MVNKDPGFSCPRCGNVRIIEYDNTIECPECKLEFDKSALEQFNNENVLSLNELKVIFDSFEELKESNDNKKEAL